MAEQTSIKAAKSTYQTLCSFLDNQNFKYKGDEEKLQIDFTMSGDDLPMDMRIRVSTKSYTVILLSFLPILVPEDKRVEFALAVSVANYGMVDGSFDYDITSGHLVFRMTHSFLDSLIGQEAFHYIIACSTYTVDEYNDRFLMLSKGMMTLEQFIAKENE